jgi:diguanylate cyclase (GGDEF)-like protein
MKEETLRVFEGDIPADSTHLHYYERDEGVRSLIAVPILAAGARRGAVFLDSVKPKAFAAGDLAKLEGFARCVGMLAYHAYLAFEYNQHREQLKHFSRYQRKFLENMSVDNIVGVVGEYMRESLEADRYLVAALAEPGSDQAEVLAAEGADAERLRGFHFGLEEGGLFRLVFEKEQVVNRVILASEPVFRMSPKEPYNTALQSLLAVPVPTDRGVDMALCVESTRPLRFAEPYQNLLVTIARAAGFALSRARLYHEKEELASRDGLTGVLNHRAFQERFRDELLRAQRMGRNVALLMLDIDFFKRINDTYGHPVGDVVLRETAQILAQNVRAGVDVVARYGGEEFVCMLPDSDGRAALETAERIRQTLEAKEFDLGHARFRATLSIGGAVFPENAKHGKELLEKADKALYKAKDGGRNQVILYH